MTGFVRVVHMLLTPFFAQNSTLDLLIMYATLLASSKLQAGA